MSYACFDKMSSCPHMDGPYGQSTAFGLFCLLWHQLATTNQHIYFMYFPYSRNSTPQFLSQFISGNFRHFCVRSYSILPATFFSGTKPPIASSDSGAFPENSPQSRAGQSGSGGGKLGTGMPSHGMYTRSSHRWCPCRKKRSSTPETRFSRSSCTPLDSVCATCLTVVS